MRALMHLIGYILIAGLGVRVLTSMDQEPLGASVVLVFFAVVGATLSSLAYGLSTEWLNRSPGRAAALLTGALSATVFFAALPLVHIVVGGILIPVLAAIVVLVAVSLIAPRCSVGGITIRSTRP
jgi:hypothetical protein